MKKILLLVFLLSGFFTSKAQDVFLSTSSVVSFFSKTPVEDIDAISKQVIGAVNVKNKSVYFKAKMTTFEFKKALMQEHFNENYMESEKYPTAVFNGVINEKMDLTKEGTYPVTVTGNLNMHGVDQQRTISGNITVQPGSIDLSCDFEVKLSDHKISIPTVVVKNIAEVVKVNVQATLLPVKSDK